MRKSIIALLATLMCVLLVGCGQGDEVTEEPLSVSSADSSPQRAIQREVSSGERTESRFSPSGASADESEAEATLHQSASQTAPPQREAFQDIEDAVAYIDNEDESLRDAEQLSPAAENNYTVVADAPDSQTSQTTCTFQIDCTTAVEYQGLSNELRRVLPENGVLYSGTVEIREGDSVFDILTRVTRESGIPMEFSSSAAFGSKYIEGINSLYEFDCGSNSGWTYFVNGERPGVGCDKCRVNPGDNVRWFYTLDLGNDINY